jgi:hypothetical protein
MIRLRLRGVIAVLTLVLVASSQGCANGDGPPFEPGDIATPRSLLITKSDIEVAGASTPYGTLLRWWQALQRGDVEGVKRIHKGRISTRVAKREIAGLGPRHSLPISPDVETQGNHVTVDMVVRAATRSAATPGVVSITDYPASLSLVRTPAGWKLGPASYVGFLSSRQFPHLAGG